MELFLDIVLVLLSVLEELCWCEFIFYCFELGMCCEDFECMIMEDFWEIGVLG